jgi:membrane protease YdiL (CAAX protease family)
MRKNFLQTFKKEDLVTGGVIVSCLFLYAIFPANNVFQQIISSLTFLLVIPFLYVKIILKKSIKNFGFKKGNWITGIFWSVISLVISASIAYIIFRYFGFLEKYPFPRYLASHFLPFLAYEVLLVGFFAFLYETFFRGFLMFSFTKKLGFLSIILQAFVFFLLFLISGTISWTQVPYFIFLLFAGLITYFSDSIIYSLVTFVIFNIIFDSFFIYAIK